MNEQSERRAALLPHLRGEALAPGEPVPLPIVPASIFHLPGDPGGRSQYGRYDNPTWEGLEKLLAHLEDAECVAFPSGMAAISAVFLSLAKTGDRILLPSDGYYTTRLLVDRFLRPLGIGVHTRPTANFSEGGFDGYALVFVETPSNPGLDLCDIAAVSEAAHTAGAVVIADNTTMTPFGQRPLDLGVDVVVAADTKAPNGHSDTLMGHVASRYPQLMALIRDWRKLGGAIPGPFEAWLVHRGLETLEVRFDRMCRSAEVIADRLQEHPAIRAVRYPGLKGDPAYELAARQMLRFGSLIGITFASEKQAEHFINACPLVRPATSFGGVHTSAERRARWGDAVPEGFVRLSIGCEPTEALWKAMASTLDQIG
jgi:cystathionine gamma-lyase